MFDKLRNSSGGQFSEVDELVPLALALIILIVTVSVGAIILNDFETVAFDEVTVTDERHNVTGALPQNFTVDRQSQAAFQQIEDGSVAVRHFDATDSSNTTLPSGNFTVFNTAGIVQIDAVGGYEDPEDVFFTDYTSLEDTDEAGVFETGVTAAQDFADFFSIIIVVAVAAVIFLLLRVVRRNGQSVSSR